MGDEKREERRTELRRILGEGASQSYRDEEIVDTWELRAELAPHVESQLLTPRDIKRLPNEKLSFDKRNRMFRTEGKHQSKILPDSDEYPVLGALSETRKMMCNPLFIPEVSFGLAGGHMWHNTVDFYRAVHRDTRAFCQVSIFWLLSARFQDLLSRELPVDGLRTNMFYDPLVKLWIPRKQEWLMSNDKVDVQICWDSQLHAWVKSE